ncbi:MAG: peptidoglycan-binding protein [Okeania sp. SIO1H6]|nr:peptidoglycan-binding protein [Okeania sp. SIO1H6]
MSITTRPTLTLNSTGEYVKDLQKVLNATVANDSLVVDGVFGNLTKEAVIAFQRYYRLTADGIVGPRTWETIDDITDGTENATNARTTLTLNSTGEDVKHLQRRLNVLNYGPLAADGIFGVATEKAVKKFQKFNDLTVDGIVGPQTWERLALLG